MDPSEKLIEGYGPLLRKANTSTKMKPAEKVIHFKEKQNLRRKVYEPEGRKKCSQKWKS